MFCLLCFQKKNIGVNVGVMNDSILMFGGLAIDVVGASSDVDRTMMLSTKWTYVELQQLSCEQNLNCRFVYCLLSCFFKMKSHC